MTSFRSTRETAAVAHLFARNSHRGPRCPSQGSLLDYFAHAKATKIQLEASRSTGFAFVDRFVFTPVIGNDLGERFVASSFRKGSTGIEAFPVFIVVTATRWRGRGRRRRAVGSGLVWLSRSCVIRCLTDGRKPVHEGDACTRGLRGARGLVRGLVPMVSRSIRRGCRSA